MARRIKKANISFISLVPAGANQVPVLYKGDDDTFTLQTIVKADMEKGEITGIVYAPEVRDSQGDIADAEAVREMCHSFAKNGSNIDIRHNGKALSKDQAYPAESFIIAKGDSRFANVKTSKGVAFDATGAWAVVLKIEDAELRQLYRDGEWRGISMGGTGAVTVEKAGKKNKMHRLAAAVAEHLGMKNPRGYTTTTITGDLDMTSEELKKELTESHKTLAAEIGKSVVDALKPVLAAQADETLCKAAGVLPTDTDEVKAARITMHKAGIKTGTVKVEKSGANAEEPEVDPNEPVFDMKKIGDATAVEEFEYKSAVYKIQKAADPKDPTSLKKAAAEIAKLKKPGDKSQIEGLSADDVAAGILKEDSDREKDLKRELFKIKKGSNQGAGGDGKEAAAPNADLTKEEQDQQQSGVRMGKHLQEGYERAAGRKPALVGAK